jgi:hypothetical protein
MLNSQNHRREAIDLSGNPRRWDVSYCLLLGHGGTAAQNKTITRWFRTKTFFNNYTHYTAATPSSSETGGCCVSSCHLKLRKFRRLLGKEGEIELLLPFYDNYFLAI